MQTGLVAQGIQSFAASFPVSEINELPGAGCWERRKAYTSDDLQIYVAGCRAEVVNDHAGPKCRKYKYGEIGRFVVIRSP